MISPGRKNEQILEKQAYLHLWFLREMHGGGIPQHTSIFSGDDKEGTGNPTDRSSRKMLLLENGVHKSLTINYNPAEKQRFPFSFRLQRRAGLRFRRPGSAMPARADRSLEELTAATLASVFVRQIECTVVTPLIFVWGFVDVLECLACVDIPFGNPAQISARSLTCGIFTGARFLLLIHR